MHPFQDTLTQLEHQLLVELACDLTHIDPLWAWQTLQDKAEPLGEATWSLMNALELLRFQSISKWPQYEEQVCTCLRGIAGHFFSTARRLNLRLPDQAFLENTFLPLQPLRATPFSRQEESAMMQTLATLSENIMHGLMDLSEVPEPTLEPAPTAPESTPDLPEAVERTEDAAPLSIRLPHVEAARLLLQGRAITSIGGTPDPAHHAALVQDLGLAHLDWIPVDAFAHGTHASSHPALTTPRPVAATAVDMDELLRAMGCDL